MGFMDGSMRSTWNLVKQLVKERWSECVLSFCPMDVPKIPTLAEWCAEQPKLKRGEVARFVSEGRRKWVPDRPLYHKPRLTKESKKTTL